MSQDLYSLRFSEATLTNSVGRQRDSARLLAPTTAQYVYGNAFYVEFPFLAERVGKRLGRAGVGIAERGQAAVWQGLATAGHRYGEIWTVFRDAAELRRGRATVEKGSGDQREESRKGSPGACRVSAR